MSMLLLAPVIEGERVLPLSNEILNLNPMLGPFPTVPSVVEQLGILDGVRRILVV